MSKKKTIAKLHISPELAGQTAMTLLKEHLGISSRQRQKVIRTKGLFADGKHIHSHAKLKPGQLLEVKLPLSEQVKVIPKQLPLKLIFQDEHLLVVDKPTGIIVHPTNKKTNAPSMVQAVAFHFQQHGIALTPRPVHRLDQGTSGVLIFAKSAPIQQKLTELWPQATKLYWALVEGKIDKAGVVDSKIRGKWAKTSYLPLKCGPDWSGLKVTIASGRTHQIRIHLSEIGHPVLGDPKYQRAANHSFPRLALHCQEITLPHPETGEQLVLSSPIPPELQQK